jgi:hypothetical protein
MEDFMVSVIVTYDLNDDHDSIKKACEKEGFISTGKSEDFPNTTLVLEYEGHNINDLIEDTKIIEKIKKEVSKKFINCVKDVYSRKKIKSKIEISGLMIGVVLGKPTNYVSFKIPSETKK